MLETLSDISLSILCTKKYFMKIFERYNAFCLSINISNTYEKCDHCRLWPESETVLGSKSFFIIKHKSYSNHHDNS
jgi:hypothetical protein